MAFKTPRRRVSDAENKLRLLCCVQALQQVTEAQLWPFVASLELMEYVPMQLLLHELLDSGDLEEGSQALSGRLSLSKQGQEQLRLFGHRVMASDQEAIQKAAPAYRMRMQKQRQVRAAYESASAGDYRVLFSIQEGEVPTLSLRAQTDSGEWAAESIRHFDAGAPKVLVYLYGLCSQAESAPSADVFTGGVDKGDIESHSPHEHTVRVGFAAPAATFDLALLLPSLETARAFQRLLARPEVQKQTAERLMALLSGEDPCETGPGRRA